jgi:hypothetical protein
MGKSKRASNKNSANNRIYETRAVDSKMDILILCKQTKKEEERKESRKYIQSLGWAWMSVLRKNKSIKGFSSYNIILLEYK